MSGSDEGRGKYHIGLGLDDRRIVDLTIRLH